MKTSIIILNYNTPELVYNCLQSISAYIKGNYEVIVVDNGSEQKVGAEAIAKFPNTKCFFLDENLGFGKGNNFGVTKSEGEILWFLNSDTIVPDDSINDLIEFVQSQNEVGIASPLLYSNLECTEIQNDMIAHFQSLKTLLTRKARGEFELERDSFETDVIAGASILMRRQVFFDIGEFDPNIFMFMEDDDICFKSREHGYKNVVLNKAKIVHLQGKSITESKERKKLYYRSQDYFWQKHYGTTLTLIMKIIRWPYKIARGL